MTAPDRLIPPADGTALLRAEQVGFQRGGSVLLSGITFSVVAGEVLGLIGPNGAGKSTLLKVISGLWPVTSGTVLLLGQPLKHYSTRAVAQVIAQVPQITSLDFPFTVHQVVLMGRNPHLSRFELETARDREIAGAAMRQTATEHLAGRLIGSLSGGERQRVLIARALAQEPRLLLLDEPTANLDLQHQMAILDLLRRLAVQNRVGVVVAVHDLEMAARYCDRLILMHQGGILAEGAPDQVLTPARLRQAYGVESRAYPDPVTGHLRLAVISDVEA